MRTSFSTMLTVAAGLKKTLGIAAVSAVLLAQSSPLAVAAEKYAAFIVDANNGKVLFSKNADDLRYPASLTKMMTLYLLFESMKDGRNALSTPMTVSAYAAGQAPSKLGLRPGSTLTVEEGILALVTKSANDAAVAICEHVGGSEQRFAQMMTAKARQLGMSRTTFRNCNGLPNASQMTTARDMATLGIALREHFPREFAYFKTRSFNFRGHVIGSHNRLIGRVDGVDGIKTGYVNASGFNLVSSLLRGDKKMVGVVMGGTSGAARDKNMAELLTRYLPSASGRSSGPLLASASPRQGRVHASDDQPAQVAASEAPNNVPVPTRRAPASVNQRIAMAYGSDAGDAIARMASNQPQKRTIIGRDALRDALNSPQQEPRGDMAIETASSLAQIDDQPSRSLVPRSASSQQLVPPGLIPAAVQTSDATMTSSLAAPRSDNTSRSDDAPQSAWIVQIAAMPDRDRAMEMLSQAKSRGGPALAGAQAFTQAVSSGSQTLHRARFAGFDTKGQANAACAALKQRSYNCYAIAN